MKRLAIIITTLWLAFTICYAQNSTVNRATAEQLPYENRTEYIKQATNFLHTYYSQLMLNVDELVQQEFIKTNMPENAQRYKPEFMLTPNKNMSFLTPEQYLQELGKQYLGYNTDNIEITVDNVNINQDDFFMPNIVKLYVIAEYDLTLSYEEKILFKRRCRAYCLFPKAMVYIKVKLMQIEPLKDLTTYTHEQHKVDIIENNFSSVEKDIYIFDDSQKNSQAKTVSQSTVLRESNIHNGYEYVNLGLSVNWASYNLGETPPYSLAQYFAWGEIIDKLEFKKSKSITYKQKNLFEISADPGYDAASAKMKGRWRMPTKREIQELIEKCNWVWNAQKKGYDVIGPNGNSIFIFATYMIRGSYLHKDVYDTVLWSSSSTDDKSACVLWFNENTVIEKTVERHIGACIRPVFK